MLLINFFPENFYVSYYAAILTCSNMDLNHRFVCLSAHYGIVSKK